MENSHYANSNNPSLHPEDDQNLFQASEDDYFESCHVNPEVEARELAELYSEEEYQTEPNYGNPEDEEYELAYMNDDDRWCGEGREDSDNVETPLAPIQDNTQRLNQNSIKISDGSEIQIILQSYVNSVPSLSIQYWEAL